MTVRPRFRHTRKSLLTLAAAVTLALGGLIAVGAATSARAATQEPCDIYAAAGSAQHNAGAVRLVQRQPVPGTALFG